MYANSIVKYCLVEHNMKKSATELYSWIHSKFMGEGDGSYCFMEGHCTNEAVTDNTTLPEAEAMCDARFGHKGWTGNFLLTDGSAAMLSTMVGAMTLHPASDPFTGVHDQKITKVFLKLACSMGNYHCDVQYCKHTFCKNPYYIARYKHLQPKTPGHLIRDL